MIRPAHALKLSRTKMKSKRIALYSSIVVSSILFAVLIAGVIIYSGLSKSATRFVQAANDNRYLVSVAPVIPSGVYALGGNLTIDQVHEIEAYQTQYYAAIKAQYKALNLPYDPSTEIPALIPAAYKPPGTPAELRVNVNNQSPVIQALLKQKYDDYAKTAPGQISDLEATAQKYHGSGFYLSGVNALPYLPNTRFIQSGKENFGITNLKTGDQTSYGYFTNAIYNSFYNFSDQSLLGRYIIKASTTHLKGIPVIISAQEAATLFGASVGIGPEPAAQDKQALWLQSVQTKLAGTTYQACYRNSTEEAMLNKIQSDYAEGIINANNKDYKTPDLTYAYPRTPCGDIITVSDTRTSAEKAAAANDILVQKKLGTYQPPTHKLLTFQIVGFINAQHYINTTTNINDYLKNLITVNSLTDSAIIPTQLYQNLPSNLKVDDLIKSQNDNHALDPRVVSFPTVSDAEAFMKNETCPAEDTNCSKTYLADPYGSNYVILDQLGKVFARFAAIALPTVLGLALIIIWFTISRIMSENRKETAVYRAMGAHRADIVAIYLIYIVLIGLRIMILSFVVGAVAALVVNYTYGPRLTSVALSSFGSVSGAPSFSLFDVSSPLLGLVALLILLVCLVAGIPSLVRNVLRAPISDIRSE